VKHSCHPASDEFVARNARAVRVHLFPTGFAGRYTAAHSNLIPNCGKLDSSSPTEALERCAHISLDHRTFLQWMSRWNSRRISQGLRVLVLYAHEFLSSWPASAI